MKRPVVRAMDVQDTLSREAARISHAMNEVAAAKIMLAQSVQGLTPDQASMCCVIAHAFSLQRLLHYPGLDKAVSAALSQIAKNIMDQADNPRMPDAG